jgi:hypothetical protein
MFHLTLSPQQQKKDKWQISVDQRTYSFLFTFSDFSQPIGLRMSPNQSHTLAGNFLVLADLLFAGISTYCGFEARKVHHAEHSGLFTSTKTYRWQGLDLKSLSANLILSAGNGSRLPTLYARFRGGEGQLTCSPYRRVCLIATVEILCLRRFVPELASSARNPEDMCCVVLRDVFRISDRLEERKLSHVGINETG